MLTRDFPAFELARERVFESLLGLIDCWSIGIECAALLKEDECDRPVCGLRVSKLFETMVGVITWRGESGDCIC